MHKYTSEYHVLPLWTHGAQEETRLEFFKELNVFYDLGLCYSVSFVRLTVKVLPHSALPVCQNESYLPHLDNTILS